MMMTNETAGVRLYTTEEVAELVEKARREGHAEGYERGYCDGTEDAHEEIAAQLAAAGLRDAEDRDDRLVALLWSGPAT